MSTALPFLKQGDPLDRLGFSDIFSMDGIPDGPGVYALTYNTLSEAEPTIWFDHILYIGSSKNIKKRLSNKSHIRFKLSESDIINDALYIRTLEVADYQEVERLLIRMLRPMLNIQNKRIRIKDQEL